MVERRPSFLSRALESQQVWGLMKSPDVEQSLPGTSECLEGTQGGNATLNEANFVFLPLVHGY